MENEKPKKRGKIGNFWNAVKLTSAIGLASLYSNDADAQGIRIQTQPRQKDADREINITLGTGLSYNLNNPYSSNAKGNLQLDFIMMKEEENRGMGIKYGTNVSQTHLGQEPLRIIELPVYDHKIIQETTTNLYLDKRRLQGVTSFKGDKATFYVSGGFQQDKFTRILETNSFKESDGIREEIPVQGRKEELVDDITVHLMGGVGLTYDHKNFSAGMTLDKTFGKIDNDVLLGVKFLYTIGDKNK